MVNPCTGAKLPKIDNARERYLSINEINLLRKVLIDSFDENSRNLGLKVPEHRCWFSPCKCKAKYRVGNTNLYLCKKHSDAEQDLIELYGN